MKEHQHVAVSSTVLNPENFRHRPAASQEEILSYLYGDDIKRAEMVALATDIAQNGLDLSNLPILEPVDSYWRVLEGNRRFASLKVMGNPDLLPDLDGLTEQQMRTYRGKFVRIGAVAVLPRTVFCLVTDDLDYANHLILLRHATLGAHKGAGTVLWNSEGRARFEEGTSGAGGRAPSNRQTANALALLRALATHFEGDDEITELIDKAMKRGLTIVGRLLISSENQLRLGVQMDGTEVRFIATRAAIRAAMLRILTDVGTPDLNTRSTNKAPEISDYLDKIEGDLPVSKDRLPSPEAPTAPASGSAAADKTRAQRRKQPAVMRKPFVGLDLYHATPKTKKLLAQIKTLQIEDYPHLLAIAMRALIDLYTADVMAALDQKVADEPSKRARKCWELFNPPGTTTRKRQFPRIGDALATNVGDLSIDTMNGFMHRSTHNPTADTIRVQVANYQPWLKALDEHVEAYRASKPAT